MSAKSNNILKFLIVILIFLLIGGGSYFYKSQQDSALFEKIILDEKVAVLKDLKISKDSLNIAIKSNTNLSEELIAERDKVQIMMSQIEAAKGDKVLMMKYISESKALKSKIQKLILQVNLLENTNKNLVAVINTTQTRLIKEEIYADTLKSQNKKMNSKIVNASSLAILNLQSIAIKEKSSGKQIETDKASKADILKISFLIAENKIAKSGDKSYFVQVIDYRGEVLGEKIKESFKSFILSYSFLATVKYENQTVKIEKDLPVSNIKPGIYYINIYDKDEVVARSTFTLK